MAELRFNEEKHIYTNTEGVKVPSVTSILAAVGMYKGLDNIPAHILQTAAERGKIVHSIIEYHCQGVLDESSIDPELIGYYEAYLQCRKDHPEIFDKLTFFEKQVYSKKYNYCGRCDAGGERIRIDFKTTAQESAVTGLQLSAYWMADYSNYACDKPDLLLGLYLHQDATYNLAEYRYEPLQWISCLTVHNWQKKNGI